MKTNYSNKAGLPPGTLTYVGTQSERPVSIRMIDYDVDAIRSKDIQDLSELEVYKDPSTITWINLDGVHNLELITELGDLFGIHPLLLEDIVNTAHRPKLEEHDDQIFFTLKMLLNNEESSGFRSEQVSIVMGGNYVLSFQETSQDIFDQVRQRIETSKGRIRKRGADYLVYALMDAVVDSYFGFIDAIDGEVSKLEDRVMFEPEKSDFRKILALKKELESLRRFISPLREALGFLEKSESELIDPRTRYFFRDVYDHILLVSDSIEASRESLNNVLDTFNSTTSNHMNQVMKTLTIIATIFIPLTFIAGLYGMNFEYMPELHWKWSYPVVLLAMAGIFAGMMRYLKKNKWI